MYAWKEYQKVAFLNQSFEIWVFGFALDLVFIFWICCCDNVCCLFLNLGFFVCCLFGFQEYMETSYLVLLWCSYWCSFLQKMASIGTSLKRKRNWDCIRFIITMKGLEHFSYVFWSTNKWLYVINRATLLLFRVMFFQKISFSSLSYNNYLFLEKI